MRKKENLKMSDLIKQKEEEEKKEEELKDKWFALNEVESCDFLVTRREKKLYYNALIDAINWGKTH